jgi:hypothetical protein
VAANSWLYRRLAFLHALYQCKWVRCSNDANPRETKVAANLMLQRGPIGYAVGGGLTPYNPATAAQVNCCVLADLAVLPTAIGDRTHHRRILLRGLPQSMINGNTLNEGGAGYNGLINFLNLVARGRSPNFPAGGVPSEWRIRFQSPTQAFQQITALTVPVGDPRSIVLSAPLPVGINGARIAVRGVNSPRGVNRIWTIRTPAPTAAGGPYPLQKVKFDIAGAWDNTGQANLVVPAYAPANQYTLIGLRDKHTGASPFGRTRGRRRAR